MKNVAFSIWAVGFPIAMNIGDTSCKEYNEGIYALNSVILFAIWGFVAYKLYEK